ncbi:MAG: F0F1 ATP synthase subunit gamma, partial [Desulfobacteraceae bacterium]
MPQLKEVLLKINGIKKTKQITKAMNMVAASRLRGAQAGMEAFRPYAAKFAEVLGSLAENAGEEASPLLVPREEPKKVNIVLTTSDRGLCGGFNFNLIDKAEALAKEKSEQGMDVHFTCFGKKGRDYCRSQKMTIAGERIGVVGGNFGFNVAVNAGRELAKAYLDGEFDEVYIVYAEFIGMAKQLPVIKQLLPIPPIDKAEEETSESEEYLAEHIC